MSYIRIIFDIQNQRFAHLISNHETMNASYENHFRLGALFNFTLQNHRRVREMHGRHHPSGLPRPLTGRVRASAKALAYPPMRADSCIYPQAGRHAGLSHVTLDNRVDKPEQVRKGCAKSLFFLQRQQTDHFLSSCTPRPESGNSSHLCVFCAITVTALHRACGPLACRIKPSAQAGARSKRQGESLAPRTGRKPPCGISWPRSQRP